MFRNLCNLQHLHEIYADEEGPDNPQKHRKGENIWHKGHPKPNEAPDLRNFPDDEEIIKAWSLGLGESQDKMYDLGMKPEGDDEFSDVDKWFYRPHEIDATTEAGLFDQMWQDHDSINVAAGEVEAADSYDALPQNEINNMAGNLVDNYTDLALHLRQMSDQDLNECSSGSKMKLTIKVPGVGEIYKSTVFSLLNSNPEGVSSGRLKRVRSKVRNAKM